MWGFLRILQTPVLEGELTVRSFGKREIVGDEDQAGPGLDIGGPVPLGKKQAALRDHGPSPDVVAEFRELLGLLEADGR